MRGFFSASSKKDREGVKNDREKSAWQTLSRNENVANRTGQKGKKNETDIRGRVTSRNSSWAIGAAALGVG